MIKVNFKAYNNYVTDSLYQWDINQSLNISGLNLTDAPEVHFANANMERAIVRQSTINNGTVTVLIPNSLLQEPLPIKAYIGVYEGETFKVIESIKIPVIAKEKPMDYSFVDDGGEVYSYNEILNKMIQFENKYGDIDFSALSEYNSLVETVKTMSGKVENTYTKNETDSLLNSNAIMASYLAFAGNVNAEMVSAGLGKNNEDNIKGVGRALAMYAKFYNPSVAFTSLSNLVSCDTLDDIVKNRDAKISIVNNYTLCNFIFTNEYAFNKFNPDTIATVTCNDSTTNYTRTTTFSVTNDMLTGEKLFILVCEQLGNATQMGSGYGVYINDIEVKNAMSLGKTITGINLADYNITAPGEYTLKGTIGSYCFKQRATLYSI